MRLPFNGFKSSWKTIRQKYLGALKIIFEQFKEKYYDSK
jgi:hypothetical protein